MIEWLRRHAGTAALLLALLSLVLSMTGLADAARQALFAASSKPRPHGLLLLGRNAKFPASAIPTVGKAKNATRLGGQTLPSLTPTCPQATIDFGTYCIATALYQEPSNDAGLNNYFYATRACAHEGGYLPSAGQLIGAADRVPLASVLTDNPVTSTIQQPDTSTSGLSDMREMTSTLVTTTAGSSAAGSEGVSQTATGDPNAGAPNPTPQPADPDPETLQYVTVYDNYRQGGFAGSQSVGSPENFRCAFDKVPPNSGIGPDVVRVTHSQLRSR